MSVSFLFGPLEKNEIDRVCCRLRENDTTLQELLS